MKFDVAIIGGTGIGSRLLELGGKPVHVPTPYGIVRAQKLEHEGVSILLMSRHSAGHKVPPHLVNYRGMADALRRTGVRFCLASAAVGSLRREWGPGTFVACSDFFDLTFRNQTMFDRTVVHTDFTEPFGVCAREAILQAGDELEYIIQSKGIYLGGNGPRYETPEEIKLYAQIRADVVGMTASTEAIVMRESGVDYACLAVVTNLAAGISSTPLHHGEVEDEMKRSGERAVKVLLRAARILAKLPEPAHR